MLYITAIDSNNWAASQIDVGGISPISYVQQYSNAITLQHTPLLTDIADVSVQYDAFTALTNVRSLSSNIESVSQITDYNLIAINQLRNKHGGAITYDINTNTPLICAASSTAEQFHYLSFSGNYVQILHGELWLTVNPISATLSYSHRNNAHPEYQTFRFVKQGSNISLMTTLTSVSAQYLLAYSPSASAIQLTTNAFVSGGSINTDWSWEMLYGDATFTVGYDFNQLWHQYHNSLIPDSRNLDATIDTSKTRKLTNQYIISYPIASGNGTLLATLKNHINAQHQQVIVNDSVALRHYTSLAMPSNQSRGWHEPSVTYDYSLHDLMLHADQVTWFHYPYTASATPISASDLITAGAIAGSSPLNADTIMTSQRGYNCTTFEGVAGKVNGTWLCSWLSGSDDGTNQPIWVDRWYDAGTVTQGSALFAVPSATAIASDGAYVWDVPSNTQLIPGVLYAYNRQGPKHVTAAIKQMDNNLLLHINNWYPPVDSSGNANNVHSNISVANAAMTPLSSDGTLYASVALKDSLIQPDAFTFAGWAHCDNWSNGSGNQIFGNYYESGFAISYNTGIYSIMPITVGDLNYGTVTVLNDDGDNISQKMLPARPNVASVTNIAVTRSQTKWIIDGANNIAYCMDFSNSILISHQLPVSANYRNLVIAGDDSAYMLDSNSNAVIHFDQTRVTSVTAIASAYNAFVLDANDQIIATIVTPGTIPTTDSMGNIIRIVGNNVYKNNNLLFFSGPSSCSIACDINDNIWVAQLPGKLHKIDSNGKLLAAVKLPDIINARDLKLNIVRQNTAAGLQDFVLATSVTQNKMIKVSDQGKIVGCFDLRKAAGINTYVYRNDVSSVVTGDITGYDVFRRYQGKRSVIAKMRVQNGCDQQPQTLVIQYLADNLAAGWHHFAIKFDNTQGVFALLVDGSIVGRIDFSPQQYRVLYTYKPPIVIGGDSGKYATLLQELQFERYRGFIGQIDDVRYYDRALNASELRLLASTKQPYANINWSIPVSTNAPRVDTIQQWFVHKLPDSKSNIFDVTIKNSGINDPDVRAIIEAAVAQAISKIKPVHTTLRRINWA